MDNDVISGDGFILIDIVNPICELEIIRYELMNKIDNEKSQITSMKYTMDGICSLLFEMELEKKEDLEKLGWKPITEEQKN